MSFCERCQIRTLDPCLILRYQWAKGLQAKKAETSCYFSPFWPLSACFILLLIVMLSQLCSGLVVSKECAIFWLYHVCAVVKTLLTVLARPILSFISILTFQLLWQKHIFHYRMCTLLLVGYHACAVRNCVLVVNLVLDLLLVLPHGVHQLVCRPLQLLSDTVNKRS